MNFALKLSTLSILSFYCGCEPKKFTINNVFYNTHRKKFTILMVNFEFTTQIVAVTITSGRKPELFNFYLWSWQRLWMQRVCSSYMERVEREENFSWRKSVIFPLLKILRMSDFFWFVDGGTKPRPFWAKRSMSDY